MKKLVTLLALVTINAYGMEQEHKHNFIFSHGFSVAGGTSKRFVAHDIVPKDCSSFHYQDARYRIEVSDGWELGLNTWDSCLAQDGDIEKLASEINEKDHDKIVLFGESRGASAIINYLGSKHVHHNKIKAAVLDSPFDKIPNVITHRMRRLYLDRIIPPKLVEWGLAFFYMRNYKIDGIQPIHSIEKISQEIPLLFLCSQEDTRVPWKSSAQLYKKLREKGHDKAHILMLDCGAHGFLVSGKYGKIYRDVTHAFYKKYGIEYNPDYATAGEDIFAIQCQPTIKEIEDTILLYQ